MVKEYIRHNKDTSNPNFPHGKFAGYRAGCKCPKCNEANNNNKRLAYHKRKLPKEPKMHFKVCGGCHQEKTFSEFYKSGDYLNPYCKSCETLRRRKYFYKRKYNLTIEDYEALLKSQNYVCAMNGEKFKGREPFVDHDHTTGKIRGLLCGKCNFGLGHFDDQINKLQNAISYLRKSAADCPETGVSSN